MESKKTAFLIGTGPSLRGIDVSLLKDYRTMTFNRAYVAFPDWGFDPNYYVSIDSNDLRSVYKDVNDLIENSKVEKFYIPVLDDNRAHSKEWFQDGDKKDHLFDYTHPKICALRFNDFIGRKNFGAAYYMRDQHSFSMINFHIWANGGLVGLKILYLMGYRRVFLLGCDARYRDDDESNKYIIKDNKGYMSTKNYDLNHFRHDYFGKGIAFGKPNEEQIIRMWGVLKKQIARDDLPLEIISCSKGSNLNQFYEYRDFYEVLSELEK